MFLSIFLFLLCISLFFCHSMLFCSAPILPLCLKYSVFGLRTAFSDLTIFACIVLDNVILYVFIVKPKPNLLRYFRSLSSHSPLVCRQRLCPGVPPLYTLVPRVFTRAGVWEGFSFLSRLPLPRQLPPLPATFTVNKRFVILTRSNSQDTDTLTLKE